MGTLLAFFDLLVRIILMFCIMVFGNFKGTFSSMYNTIQVGAGTTREAVEKCRNEFRLKGM